MIQIDMPSCEPEKQLWALINYAGGKREIDSCYNLWTLACGIAWGIRIARMPVAG
jgi:hypothetical protein